VPRDRCHDALVKEFGVLYLVAAVALLVVGGVLSVFRRRACQVVAVVALVLVAPMFVAYVVERDRLVTQRCERVGGEVERAPRNSKALVCVRDGLVVLD